MPTPRSETAEDRARARLTALLFPPDADRAPHVCSYCRNPTGVLNPECPNRTKENR